MDIYLLQMAITRGKPTLNRAKVLALTANLKPGKFSLLIFPELFSTGYLDESALDQNSADEWAKVAQEDRNFLASLAQKLNCSVLGTTTELGPLNKDGQSRFRNLSLLFASDGSEIIQYQKIHPFSYGGEDRIFSRGNTVVTYALKNPETSTAEEWIIQPTICYDLRFPELFRMGSAQGAHLIVVQANWPAARQSHWESLLKARAIENQAFVAGVNCIGNQDALVFSGGSVLISPYGEVLAHCGIEEMVLHAKLDLDQCKEWRKTFPALRDRLPWDFFTV